MAVKKSFKTEWNPALQFISVPEEAEIEPQREEVEKPPEPQKAQINGAKPLEPVPSQINGPKGSSAPQIKGAKPPEGLVKGPKAPPLKRNPLYVETKSRRLQLLMQPSLYERVRERAGEAGQSVNEWIHSCLETACGGGETF